MTDDRANPPRIQTARTIMESMRRSDAGELFAYRADPGVARYQNWAPGTLADANDFIARGGEVPFATAGHWFQLAIRSRDSDRLLGDLGLHFLPRDSDPAVPGQVEIGISIAPDAQRQGYAKEALAAVLATLFDEHAVHRVIASVDPRNAASMALFPRLGFDQEGHFRESLWFKGEWADDVVFALRRSVWEGRAGP